MLTMDQRLEMYRGKKFFINNISKVFELDSKSNVERVDYEVYSRVSRMDGESVYYTEFVVVTFVGGAKSVRNISGNSNNATFREVGKLIDGGYYDEIPYYSGVKETGTFVEV